MILPKNILSENEDNLTIQSISPGDSREKFIFDSIKTLSESKGASGDKSEYFARLGIDRYRKNNFSKKVINLIEDMAVQAKKATKNAS